MATAGPYASLHPAPDRWPRQHPATQFFTGRMPFLPPNQQRQSTESTPLKSWRGPRMSWMRTTGQSSRFQMEHALPSVACIFPTTVSRFWTGSCLPLSNDSTRIFCLPAVIRLDGLTSLRAAGAGTFVNASNSSEVLSNFSAACLRLCYLVSVSAWSWRSTCTSGVRAWSEELSMFSVRVWTFCFR